MCDEETEIGIYAIARPIFGESDIVMNAVALVGLRSDLMARWTEDELAGELGLLAKQLATCMADTKFTWMEERKK